MAVRQPDELLTLEFSNEVQGADQAGGGHVKRQA
jgi:hypothetical protein